MRTLIAFLMIGLALGAADARADDGWLTSLAEARAQSKKTGRPILLDFTGSDWCRPCMMLEKEVFETAAFKTWAAKSVVLLTVDFPRMADQPAEIEKQNDGLADTYAVSSYPTIVFVSPAGKELGRMGYEPGGPEAFIAEAEGRMAGAPKGWTTSFAMAMALSKKSGKPILARFHGSDWCGWCIQFGKEVTSTPEFKAWAAKSVILLELDFPRKKPQTLALKRQNRKLLKRYGVRGFPTVLFLGASGKEIGRAGYAPGGPKGWIAEARRVLKRKRR